MSLDNTALRLDSAPFRIAEYLRKNFRRIARQSIEREIRLLGISHGMTDRMLSKLTINPSELELEISITTHGPTHGTKPREQWTVAPKNAQALHWVSGGTDFFSKGHMVSGVDVKYILNHGIKRGLAKFRRDIKHQTEEFMEGTSLGRI